MRFRHSRTEMKTVLFVASLVVIITIANGCSCPSDKQTSSICNLYGGVVEIMEGPLHIENDVRSQQILSHFPNTTYLHAYDALLVRRFNASQVDYRGDMFRVGAIFRIVTSTSPEACGMNYTVGERYFVAAPLYGYKMVRTSRCDFGAFGEKVRSEPVTSDNLQLIETKLAVVECSTLKSVGCRRTASRFLVSVLCDGDDATTVAASYATDRRHHTGTIAIAVFMLSALSMY